VGIDLEASLLEESIIDAEATDLMQKFDLFVLMSAIRLLDVLVLWILLHEHS
jgi:hypothetical protein